MSANAKKNVQVNYVAPFRGTSLLEFKKFVNIFHKILLHA